jgi:hypothetical protein
MESDSLENEPYLDQPSDFSPRNCGTKRTYQPEEEVPKQCPQCQRDSRPKYAWLRKKVPLLPAIVLTGSPLLFGLP